MVLSDLDLTGIETLMVSSLSQVFPCAQLQILHPDQILFSQAYGWLSPEQPCTLDCQFDISSITKLFTAIAVIRQVQESGLDLDAPVYPLLPEVSDPRPICPYEDPLHPGQSICLFSPADPTQPLQVDPQQITWRQLLSHTSGLPPWRPLYRCQDRQAAVEMALGTFFSYPPGSQVSYSDIGLIWAGLALERWLDLPLDQVIQTQVIEPLGLQQTQFRPLQPDPEAALSPDPTVRESIAPTEVCPWRGRRIWGEVHDQNAARLGGVAGHAGLFSTAVDLAQLGRCLLTGGAPLLETSMRDQMIQLQAHQGEQRRGLGFALRSDHPQASSFPLSPLAYGHTGFTGTSLWIDPHHDLVIACLTNSVYYGRDHDGILAFRVALHQTLMEALG